MSAWPVVQPLIERAPSGRGLSRAGRLLRRGEAFPPGLYIVTYHSIYDAGTAEPWQALYRRVLTRSEDFEQQLGFLRRHMQPVTLAEAPSLFADGLPDAPCFAVTFDDGYVSIAGRAAETCERLGVKPTAFVCGDFASGRSVYYRVPLVLLEAEGRGERVARALSERHERAFGAHDLMSETKNWYRRGVTDSAVLDVWREIHGDELPRVHLTYAELRALETGGWSIGNHTRSHPTLAGLTDEQLDDEVLGNDGDLRAAGLSPLSWLAYPNGAARHVDARVGVWLNRHPELNGAHANGGVNFEPSRTEWLRIPVGDEGLDQFRERIRAAVRATRWAISPEPSRSAVVGRS